MSFETEILKYENQIKDLMERIHELSPTRIVYNAIEINGEKHLLYGATFASNGRLEGLEVKKVKDSVEAELWELVRQREDLLFEYDKLVKTQIKSG